ncbi:ATP-binding cassette sub-family G member 8 isoform X1 [Leptopilina heterotoma]|uniref:ATP-binding cassette sub-family G member 8 isoform X1 n=1 Tax=Leptopilina heterotoma TaxID=63436 RepID=UPI001CA7BE77|nr:ATP-binding cassette sub-family G member 8 isoform X1 [Leptopilina heterotoma]
MNAETWELERRYSVPGALDTSGLTLPASEDLHAWSIYRQNLNSDFTDSALGSAEKSPLPYGNFQLRDSTVQSILRHPRYGPKNHLASNSYTYLKFGLPRVLPPSRTQDSSDCNSSEEGRRTSQIGIPISHYNTEMKSSRSDPDFRLIHSSENVLSPPTVGDNLRLRCVSEANLLLAEKANRRCSVALTGPQNSSGILRPKNNTAVFRPSPCLQHPHLQFRRIESSRSDGSVVLSGISFEAGATDILAIMATTEKDGTAIMETVSGRRRIQSGDILLNGRLISSRTLRSRVAYLPAESNLNPDLTVQQALNFYMLLKGGSRMSSLDAEAILGDLGLEATKHCLVDTLTASEARRLALACRLLQDSHILVLDKPTHGLDIFDAFFLMEYLRQWSIRKQRLVILTLQPPTYEILTMISRVTLTSGGKIMYSGARRDMIPYFSLIEFPCPPFKNPSDYYLDLVTLDDLSTEAMLESSQRIDHLAELAKAKLPPLSEPGIPGALPPSNTNANVFLQIYALFARALIYSQPWSLTKLIKKIVISATLSIILGAVFWDVANDSNVNLRDRIGFYYSSLGILHWPLILISIREAIKTRVKVEREMKDELYGRLVYITVKLLCNIPSWTVVYAAYLAPGYAMSGLHLPAKEESLNIVWHYFLTAIIYLLLLHLICLLLSHICKWTILAVLTSGFIIGQLSVTGGVTLHIKNLPFWYLEYNPLRWVLSSLLSQVYEEEYLKKLIKCEGKQIQQHDIIVQENCDTPTMSIGVVALKEISLNQVRSDILMWLGISIAVTTAVIMITFSLFKFATLRKTRNTLNKH